MYNTLEQKREQAKDEQRARAMALWSEPKTGQEKERTWDWVRG